MSTYSTSVFEPRAEQRIEKPAFVALIAADRECDSRSTEGRRRDVEARVVHHRVQVDRRDQV